MITNNEKDLLMKHRGKIFMAIVFALIGILFITLGFLKGIFILFLAIVGFFAGFLLDDRDMVRRFINTYLGK